MRPNQMLRLRCVPLAGWLLGILATVASAQTPTPSTVPEPLTLPDAIAFAQQHYPAVKAALEQVTASAARVDIARDAYLPRFDSMWQSTRATANNVFGQVLPQSVIPSLTGPVLDSASSQSVWGSAVGALFSWEPVDFGLRRADVASAEAALARARATEALTTLDVENAVAVSFLNVVAAQRAVSAAQADVDRRSVLRQAIQTLVDNQLRPGADASRANAEQAAAQTRLIQAQQTLAIARITLTRLLGSPSLVTVLDDRTLLSRPPPATVAPAGDVVAHPAVRVHAAAVELARAAEQVLSETDLPRLFLQGSVFARGSGANTTEPFDTGFGGFRVDRANWAAGVQIVFPNLFDFAPLRGRKAAATASTRAETALNDEAVLAVTAQRQTAAALLDSSRAIAANTPVQLEAARQSERQARARYDTGLASIVEVADAQNLLMQAEVQDELARVDVWRALLASAVAQGDLSSFLTAVR